MDRYRLCVCYVYMSEKGWWYLLSGWWSSYYIIVVYYDVGILNF